MWRPHRAPDAYAICAMLQGMLSHNTIWTHAALWGTLQAGCWRAFIWQGATARHCCWSNAFIASPNLSCCRQQVIGNCRPSPRGPSQPTSAAMTSSASSRSSSEHSSRTTGPSCRWEAMGRPWLPGARQLPRHGRASAVGRRQLAALDLCTQCGVGQSAGQSCQVLLTGCRGVSR